MKKLLLLIVFAAFTTIATAQDYEVRKGYIGLGLGPAWLTEDYTNADSGLQVNINFGYLLSQNVGIAATYFSTDFELSNYSDRTIGLAGFMAGPLFSFPSPSGKVEFDLKPMIGYVKATATIGSNSGTTTDKGKLGFAAGATVRWNVWPRISLSAGFDYYHGKIGGYDLSSYGLTIGAAYRIK